jgi:hypothetical protein
MNIYVSLVIMLGNTHFVISAFLCPMHHRQLLNSEWHKVEGRFEKTLLLES